MTSPASGCNCAIYALGRGLTFADRPTIDAIVADVARNNHGFRTLVLDVVRSPLFAIKQSEFTTAMHALRATRILSGLLCSRVLRQGRRVFSPRFRA